MDKKTNLKNQRKFVDVKKAQGLKRVVLWARPEDIETLKLAAHQPHSIAKLRKKIEAEIERELRPIIKDEITRKLRRKTERAMLAQKRTQARRHPASSNQLPSRIRLQYARQRLLETSLKHLGGFMIPWPRSGTYQKTRNNGLPQSAFSANLTSVI